MRYRLTFSKTEAMRFTGNLDLHRTLERTMRRANIQLAYSQGFNPRPQLTLADALPLGYTSDAELADCWLKEELSVDDLLKALRKSAPPGLQFHSVEAVEQGAPKLQNTIESAWFMVTLLETPPERLAEKAAALLAADELPREKTRKGKTRTYDLRTLIHGIQLIEPDEAGCPRLRLHLSQGEGTTGRPDVILEELGIDPLSVRVHRTDLIFSK